MCVCKVDHIAIATPEFEWYVSFFETVFSMNVKRTFGKEPLRQLWFEEGIQLIECKEVCVKGTSVNHIAIAVKDVLETADKALKNRCAVCPRGNNWFTLPNGEEIELIPLQV